MPYFSSLLDSRLPRREGTTPHPLFPVQACQVHGNVKVGWVRRWVRSRGDLAAIPKGIDDSEDHHLCRPIGLATTGAIRRRADLAYWGVRKEPCLVCPARRERVGDLAPAANPATVSFLASS